MENEIKMPPRPIFLILCVFAILLGKLNHLDKYKYFIILTGNKFASKFVILVAEGQSFGKEWSFI
jgi:hypothetical protein